METCKLELSKSKVDNFFGVKTTCNVIGSLSWHAARFNFCPFCGKPAEQILPDAQQTHGAISLSTVEYVLREHLPGYKVNEYLNEIKRHHA